ncbi:MAG: lipid-A-disaccharide synthase [Candidatus Muproteobacteria bacterium RBG_16_60_9]|uniref:Lipid-A-disaccharide synthase n=1 Tax=Candidatus Muproteobacteria bacterium RBG_16_60_9 TaxID=1817755 RepID=A0A1F6VHE1_9PROT|nr:MAG: lipid-A-disaccharide synthase [Candidatus Muproteobacteria bacterium RBG_16_60_9]
MPSDTAPSPQPLSRTGGGELLKIGIVAGETSGDQLAAGLMRELKSRLPGVQFEGIGGPRMQAEGCVCLADMDRLSVIGLEGLVNIPGALLTRRRLTAHFLAQRPKLYIGVDAPDFNLSVEARLRAAGVTTVHYVSPTVWAWRGYRIRKIRRAVDRMLALFPFEEEFYRTHDVPVTFVGHPLADAIPLTYDAAAVRRQLGLPIDRTLIALLPGSRLGELKRHAELFVHTAQWLHERHPRLHFVAPFVSIATQTLFNDAIARSGACGLPLTQLSGHSREALAASDVALLASGTATLEAAMLRKPMVVTYRVSRLSEMLIRLFAHVRMYALPNLLAGRMLVPELIQDDATAEKLGAAVEAYIAHPEQAESVQVALADMHASLRQNADARAADAVMAIIRERKLVALA